MTFGSTLIRVSLGAGAVVAALALDIATAPIDRAIPIGAGQIHSGHTNGGPTNGGQTIGGQSDGGQSEDDQHDGRHAGNGLVMSLKPGALKPGAHKPVGLASGSLTLTSSAWAGGGTPPGQPQRLATSKLAIESKGGKRLAFTVEVARTPEEHEIGMMFRKSVEPDAGMLFLFPEPRQASFWMYNTYIPLDLIFIKEDGRIESIAPNAKPHSLKPRQSRGAVIAVLEIAGGQSEKLGIAEGDKVLHPELKRR